MAIGLSGSNGGVNFGKEFHWDDLVDRPMEISYFVNNICNLNCKHCYVGYDNKKNSLTVEQWRDIFEQCADLGALTFGNVGKEPILSWYDKTLPLLKYFREKREKNPRLRFGLVTNAVLLNHRMIQELAEVYPTYIDISVDGTREIHDYIRGQGNYDKTHEVLRKLADLYPDLTSRLFLSFTLMRPNKNLRVIKKMVSELKDLGLRNFLVSPYVKKEADVVEGLEITNEEVASIYSALIEQGNNLVKDGQLLLKVDYDTQKSLQDLLIQKGIINLDNLLIDSYGVVYNQYGKVFINYIPVPETMSRAIRISHDGYISGCYDMFFKDYQERTRGNIRDKSLIQILNDSKLINTSYNRNEDSISLRKDTDLIQEQIIH